MNAAKQQDTLKARRAQGYHWSQRTATAWKRYQAAIQYQLDEARREREKVQP